MTLTLLSTVIGWSEGLPLRDILSLHTLVEGWVGWECSTATVASHLSINWFGMPGLSTRAQEPLPLVHLVVRVSFLLAHTPLGRAKTHWKRTNTHKTAMLSDQIPLTPTPVGCVMYSKHAVQNRPLAYYIGFTHQVSSSLSPLQTASTISTMLLNVGVRFKMGACIFSGVILYVTCIEITCQS